MRIRAFGLLLPCKLCGQLRQVRPGGRTLHWVPSSWSGLGHSHVVFAPQMRWHGQLAFQEKGHAGISAARHGPAGTDAAGRGGGSTRAAAGEHPSNLCGERRRGGCRGFELLFSGRAKGVLRSR